MYKLSYEKCVCFIFLVMVAFLSCSGFRIDKLAMTDISKRNFHTSSTSLNSHSDFLNRLVQASAGANSRHERHVHEPSDGRYAGRRVPHRIRHSHSAKTKHPASKFEPSPTSRIDAIIITDFEEPRPTTRSTSEKFAQIPPSDLKPLRPTIAISTRSQRSPNRNKQHRAKTHCQEQDFGRKAYLANTVVLAKAESMSFNRIRNYSVTFKIVERFKSPPYAVDDNLRLTFLNDTKRMNCESEMGSSVIKAQIQRSTLYYLFLNSQGDHNYTVLGMPVLKRPKKNKEIEKILNTITRKNFEPKLRKPTVTVNTTAENLQPGRLLKVVCKIKGYPTPIISWRKDNTTLHNSNHTRINFSHKGRRSTLVIKKVQERDSGHYYCVATGVTGQTKTSAPADIRIRRTSNSISNNHGEKCKKHFDDTFCMNGGTCQVSTDLGEMYCVCPDGFSGQKCDNKAVNFNIGSMYRPCIYAGFPAYYC